MPRRARLSIAGIPHHVIQRGHNRSPCFFSDRDYRFYLCYLNEEADRSGCAIHAYVLNPNHVHLLVTPDTEDALAMMMRGLGGRYVQYVNHVHRRTGTLWEGRFKSSLVDSERYLLTCYRYIELDPVRLRLVTDPGDYPWSSYGCHARGIRNGVIRDHPLYLALGAAPEERTLAYRELFRYRIDDRELNEISMSVSLGLVLGGDPFKDEIERVVARRVRPGRSGRPRKTEGGGAIAEQMGIASG
jgi:putative transposase